MTQNATNPHTHPSEPRTITLPEAMRLQSFPDDYVSKSTGLGYYIVGMSVPPRMMEVVARSVARSCFGCVGAL